MIKDLPSQSVSPGDLSFLCRQPTMSKKYIAMPEPLARSRGPLVKVAIVQISKCCLSQRSYLVPLTLLHQHQIFRGWAPRVAALRLDKGNATWLLQGTHRGLGTQHALDVMELSQHWIRSDTDENDQNSRHGNHSRNRYNVPLSLQVSLGLQHTLNSRGNQLVCWGTKGIEAGFQKKHFFFSNDRFRVFNVVQSVGACVFRGKLEVQGYVKWMMGAGGDWAKAQALLAELREH